MVEVEAAQRGVGHEGGSKRGDAREVVLRLARQRVALERERAQVRVVREAPGDGRERRGAEPVEVEVHSPEGSRVGPQHVAELTEGREGGGSRTPRSLAARRSAHLDANVVVELAPASVERPERRVAGQQRLDEGAEGDGVDAEDHVRGRRVAGDQVDPEGHTLVGGDGLVLLALVALVQPAQPQRLLVRALLRAQLLSLARPFLSLCLELDVEDLRTSQL